MNGISRRLKLVLGVGAVATLAACSSDLNGGNRHMVKLSATSRTTPTSAALAADAVPSDLVIQNIQVVLGKLELDRVGTADCIGEVEGNDDNGHDDNLMASDRGDDDGQLGEECEEVTRNPILVDIPGDGTLKPLMSIPLADGTFRELEAKIEPANAKFTDFNSTNSDLVGKSIRIKGTFKGADFTLFSSLRAKVEMEFDPPLVIDGTTRNATVSLNVAKWFLDSSGNFIDPATATPGSANLLQIENNIRRSLHAFEDDHERGEDHHEGHDGSDDGSGH